MGSDQRGTQQPFALRRDSSGWSSHYPQCGIAEQLLEPGITPHCLLVAERRIEYAAVPVGPRPSQRPPIWTPMHVGASKINRSRIEAQQHAGAAYIEIAYLIDLVCDGNRFAQEGHQRIVTVRHLDEYGLMPGMLVEIPPITFRYSGHW